MSRTKHLAAALGVHAAQVSRWKAAGMPLELEAARSWHAANVHSRRRRKGQAPPIVAAEAGAPAGDGDPPARTWRERHDRAGARIRELELQEREGTLLDVARARREFGGMFVALTQLLNAFPQKVAHDVAGKSIEAAYRALDEAIYQLRIDFHKTMEHRLQTGLLDEAVRAMGPGPKR